MNMRQWMMRARGQAAVILCLAVAATGCRNVETIAHGRQFMPDGTLQLASLQPSCGCMSLRNKSEKKVWLESTFYGIARGSMVMNRDELTRVLVDWGGTHNSDFYELAAFDVDQAGKPVRDRQPRPRIQDVLEEYAPMVDTPCGDKTCSFGPLSMNRMLEATEEQEREASHRGVNFSSVIEASAPQDKCGCMMLNNFSDEIVTLRAMLHGVETGQFDVRPGSTVPVAFDWAGHLDTDVYVVEGVDVRPANQPQRRTAAAPMTAARSAMTIRLKDYVEIAGSLVNMECTASYADFVNEHAVNDVAETNVRCPWNPGGMPGLGMHAAFDRRTKNQQSLSAAPQAK
jgi:hypothetical protein